MARKAVATVALVGAVILLVAVAGVFGYMYLLPAKSTPALTTQSQAPNTPATSTSTTTTSEGSIQISNAALSNNSLLVTIQNTGSEPVSINALTLLPANGCNLANLTRGFAPPANQTSQGNGTRGVFQVSSCMASLVAFVVQKNSTLTPVSPGRFNFTAPGFNFTAFNSTSFSRSGNFSRTFSRTFSGNSSRTFPGNFTLGNFTGIPGFFGNLSAGAGLQIAAGQSVTLEYAGTIGSGVTAGSQYTITVVGQQAEAQVTLSAS